MFVVKLFFLLLLNFLNSFRAQVVVTAQTRFESSQFTQEPLPAFGRSYVVPGDVDDNSDPDLFIGAPFQNFGNLRSGSLYVILLQSVPEMLEEGEMGIPDTTYMPALRGHIGNPQIPAPNVTGQFVNGGDFSTFFGPLQADQQFGTSVTSWVTPTDLFYVVGAPGSAITEGGVYVFGLSINLMVTNGFSITSSQVNGSTGDLFGNSVVSTPADADEFDLIVGAPGADRVDLLSLTLQGNVLGNPLSRSVSLADLEPGAPPSEFGYSVVYTTDLNYAGASSEFNSVLIASAPSFNDGEGAIFVVILANLFPDLDPVQVNTNRNPAFNNQTFFRIDNSSPDVIDRFGQLISIYPAVGEFTLAVSNLPDQTQTPPLPPGPGQSTSDPPFTTFLFIDDDIDYIFQDIPTSLLDDLDEDEDLSGVTSVATLARSGTLLVSTSEGINEYYVYILETDACGNGLISGSEECDDANLENGDGCSRSCDEESGFSCDGEPSICIPQTNSNNLTTIVIAVVVSVVVCVLVSCCIMFFFGAYVLRQKKDKGDQANSINLVTLKESGVNIITDLEIGKELGRGQFGRVYKAKWGANEVAIKAITGQDIEEFQNELKVLSEMDYPTVIRFWGIYVDDQDQYLVTEFMSGGDLQSFLQKSFDLPKKALHTISCQVADGMAYIHRKKFIHRDLACRNVLVSGEASTGDVKAKVSDFGLSRQVENYYNSNSKLIPIRWTAPEAIKFSRYDKANDVWAFGITAWEIYSRGATPYPGLSNQNVIEQVPKGLLLARPTECDQQTYQVMKQCWSLNPEKRPEFRDIVKTLSKIDPSTNDAFVFRDEDSSAHGEHHDEPLYEDKHDHDQPSLGYTPARIQDKKRHSGSSSTGSSSSSSQETENDYGLTPARQEDNSVYDLTPSEPKTNDVVYGHTPSEKKSETTTDPDDPVYQ